MPNTNVVLRLPAVCEAASVSLSTLRRLMRAGRGPRIIQLSDRLIGVRRVDLDDWLNSRSRK
ncbi:helix-turn-helix transcriptional regulator [Methylobacterium sp. M6A4_1b]